MITRRRFLTRMVGTWTLATPSLVQADQNRGQDSRLGHSQERQERHPFAPDRIVVLRQPLRVSESRKSHVLEMWHGFRQQIRHRASSERSLRVSDAKLDVLVTVVDKIVIHYPEADFDRWILGLILREDLASSCIGENAGLFHQFQHGQRVNTRDTEADLWMFLCPNGVEYDQLNGQPVHAIGGAVLANSQLDQRSNVQREFNVLRGLNRLMARVSDPSRSSLPWNQLADQQPTYAARYLNGEMAKCLRETATE